MEISKMEKAKIYHNPKCGCSRKALGLVEQTGLQFEIVEYLKTPPSKNELGEIVKRLGIHPTEIIREKEDLFRELGLSKSDQRETDEWLTILADNPILLQRPIVSYKNRSIVGRPPESVLEILN